MVTWGGERAGRGGMKSSACLSFSSSVYQTYCDDCGSLIPLYWLDNSHRIVDPSTTTNAHLWQHVLA